MSNMGLGLGTLNLTLVTEDALRVWMCGKNALGTVYKVLDAAQTAPPFECSGRLSPSERRTNSSSLRAFC